MADSIRERILKEVRERLLLTDSVGGRVYRSRAEAASRAEMPMLIVTPISDAAERVTSVHRVDRKLMVRIAVLVRGDVPDQEADPILQSLHKLLMPTVAGGWVDVTLGGLVVDMAQDGDDFEFAFTEGVVIVQYMIHYRHSEGDLAT